jgi:integrase
MTGKPIKTSQTGTMRERSLGSWQLRAFAGADPATGKPRQFSRTFHGGQRAAKKALATLVAEVDAGRFRSTSQRTVSHLLDAWLEASQSSQRPRTIYENRSKIEKRLRPRLGHIRLDKLQADAIDAAYRAWLAEGLSPATVHKLRSILSAACHQAVKWDWLDRSPTERAMPPKLVRREMKVPTPDQLSMLVTVAEELDPVLACAIALAALTGVRRGELVALRWSDLDLVKKKLRVPKGLTVTGGEQHTGPTKTHQAREIAMDPVCVKVLKVRWSYMSALSKEAESPLDDDPYVLSYDANAALPVNPDTLTHGFGSLCATLEEPALARLRKANKKVTRADLPIAKLWPFRYTTCVTSL